VALDVPEKQVTALIGPSGCGKSSFLRVMNRLNDVIDNVTVEGSIRYNGHEIYGEFDVIELRKQVGMVFQKPNPFPMTVYDNVAYGPRVHGIRRRAELDEIVESSLTQAALWEEVKGRLREPAFSLSGGQQQRLCIARALAVEPEVILMDEPTSALDPISTTKIEDLAMNLTQHYTLIVVTHNLQQAGRIADRTAFFLNGEVIEQGETTSFFFNPQHPQTEAYLSGRFG
jgi:phosphate transport system ATP-binding protein